MHPDNLHVNKMGTTGCVSLPQGLSLKPEGAMTWTDELLARARKRVADHDASREQRLRNQIEQAKEQGQQGQVVGDRLRELRAAHYDLTGADGG